ncbi:hypothetical protein SETIT_8G185800v2 [Setaria italica]|uniref:Uncharacterized protein n=1 Tax=Setaria italica TaxID=4555 RepID=A0A368S974_SETIT|nr:hypothetical protein SETIT_8G185800v2 [Setaria italica]
MASTPTGIRRTETRALRVQRGLRDSTMAGRPEQKLLHSAHLQHKLSEEQSNPMKSTSTSEAGRKLKDHTVRHVEQRSRMRSQLEKSV